MTVPSSGRVNLTSDPSSVSGIGDQLLLNSSAIVESEAENVHFQPSAWGFLTKKHSRGFANDVALALREKILAGMDFRVANRL